MIDVSYSTRPTKAMPALSNNRHSELIFIANWALNFFWCSSHHKINTLSRNSLIWIQMELLSVRGGMHSKVKIRALSNIAINRLSIHSFHRSRPLISLLCHSKPKLRPCNFLLPLPSSSLPLSHAKKWQKS